jgi:hypothetical protein
VAAGRFGATVLFTHDRAVGRDAGSEGFWQGRTVPVLERPERLPAGAARPGAVIKVRVLGKDDARFPYQ